MKIEATNTRNKIPHKVTFGRALTPKELVEYKKTLAEAKNKIGNDGKSVLIVPDTCLPQASEYNTGVGNLSSKKSLEFFDFMKNYLDINSIEILPAGEISPYQNGKFFCAYNSSAFSLSPHQINLELLTTPEFNSLITENDIKKVVYENKYNSKILSDANRWVNYENVVNPNSPFDLTLRKAYEKFITLQEDNPLKKAFKEYKKENKDWLEPKALFKALTKEYNDNSNWKEWAQQDKELLIDIDKTKQKRIKSLLSSNKQETEFYYFKQFLADKHLEHARKELNKKGLKLIGDCLIGFSYDERWAYQKAFNQEYSIGWGLPALDYETITKKGSEAETLLKRKVQLFAKRYDSIRFDVSWAYINPKLTPYDWKNGAPYSNNREFGAKILDNIDKYVKEIKGKDFDVKNLIHEFDASPADFQMVVNTQQGPRWQNPMMNRTKALGTTYMSPTWGNNETYLKLNNNTPNFILGAGNHDPQPLRQIAYAIPDINGEIHKPAQIEYLSKLFNINQQTLNNPIEFIKAKFAEILTAKHNQFFYIDVFGNERRFDSQIQNTPQNYRHKIPENYEQAYIKEVEKGHAFNPMDALEKVFKIKKLDKKEPKLYAKIVEFKNILQAKTDIFINNLMEVNSNNTTQKEKIKNISKKSTKASLLLGTVVMLIGGTIYFFSNKQIKEKGNN